MIYLTGENVFSFNSGTEFSLFERLKAFNNNGLKTKLLVRNYNRMLAKDISEHHINEADVLNMYDYFQDAVGLNRIERPLRLLESMPLKDYHIVMIDNNSSELQYQGKVVGKVNVMPETIGLVGTIEYYDHLGYVMTKEYWDWRGFRSMVETYHPDGSIASQQFLRPDGTPALEVTHMYVGKQVLPSSYKLLDYRGKDYLFDTEEQLFTFFLNEVNASAKGTFISDRRSLDQSVLGVLDAKEKLAYIHSSPFIDLKKKKLGILPAYKLALTAGNFDKVIFPTTNEADDVKEYFAKDLVTAVALDSYVENIFEPKSLSTNKTLIYVGRLSEDKNITDLVKVFKVMHERDASLKLKLQGYFSTAKYHEQLETLIKEYQLQGAVEFIFYRYDLEDIYQNATLFLNASHSEGFGMNMLESMAHGVPVVSYVIDYTEKNLLVDGYNGANVKNRSPRMLAQKALELLGSNEKYQALSANALETAKKHDENSFMLAWDKCLKDS